MNENRNWSADTCRGKRIVVVNNNMKIGGVQTSLLGFVKRLAQHNDVTLVLFARTGELLQELPEQITVVEAGDWMKLLGLSHGETKQKGLRIRSTVLRAFTHLIGFPPVIRYMLARTPELPGQWDLAVSYLQDSAEKKFYGGCNAYVLEKIHSGKKMTFIHSDYSKFGGNTPYNISLLGQFDRIALVSASCKKVFDSMVPNLSEKSIVVYNEIDKEHICELAQQSTVEYDTAKLQMVCVCRISHEKGVQRLVRAFAKANGKYPGRMQLHIIGGGPQEAEVSDLIHELEVQDSVELCGQQVNPYRYMENADILVISSYQEAAPMVIYEAYALGLRVLSTRTCSAEEMIPSEKGWVCDNSEEGLLETLSAIAETELKEEKA